MEKGTAKCSIMFRKLKVYFTASELQYPLPRVLFSSEENCFLCMSHQSLGKSLSKPYTGLLGKYIFVE